MSPVLEAFPRCQDAQSGREKASRRVLLLFAAIVFWLPTVTAQSGAHPLPENAYLLPLTWETSKNAKKQQRCYYDFVWRSFIALNWPNVPLVVENGKIVKGFRGEPIAQKDLILEQRGAGPLKYISVWETYREPALEVFVDQDQWSDFPQWNTPRPSPPGLSSTEIRPLLGFNTGSFVEYATDLNQPDFFPRPTGPLIDQNRNYVRYEVAVNQAFFTYIRHFRYFNPNQQIRSVRRSLRVGPKAKDGFQLPPHGTPEEFNSGYLKNLPAFARQGLIDVKAAWRVLDLKRGDRPERYLHREIYTGDGNTQLMGLVALHILRFTPDGQVACTFEQVDNLKGDAQLGVKPSFNNGAQASDIQQRLGFEGAIPPAIPAGATPPKDPDPVSIYRVTQLPADVAKTNEKYQKMLQGSVFQYYELIGTQNKHPGVPVKIKFEPEEKRQLNGPEGPLTGVYTNTSNLVNAALESYTQKNHSCVQCHVRARPIGVPTQAREIDQFKTLTFLLQAAQHPTTLDHKAYLGVGEYLVSPNGKCFAIMQVDGNFCIYQGSGPTDKKAMIWCSGTSGPGGAFFAAINREGQFCVYKGTSPQNQSGVLWCSPTNLPSGSVFLALEDQGSLCVIQGSPQKPGKRIWCSQ